MSVSRILSVRNSAKRQSFLCATYPSCVLFQEVERAILPEPFRAVQHRIYMVLHPAGFLLSANSGLYPLLANPFRDHCHYWQCGGLLHHLFTFFSPHFRETGCMFSVILSVSAGCRLQNPRLASVFPPSNREALRPLVFGLSSLLLSQKGDCLTPYGIHLEIILSFSNTLSF